MLLFFCYLLSCNFNKLKISKNYFTQLLILLQTDLLISSYRLVHFDFIAIFKLYFVFFVCYFALCFLREFLKFYQKIPNFQTLFSLDSIFQCLLSSKIFKKINWRLLSCYFVFFFVLLPIFKENLNAFPRQQQIIYWQNSSFKNSIVSKILLKKQKQKTDTKKPENCCREILFYFHSDFCGKSNEYSQSSGDRKCVFYDIEFYTFLYIEYICMTLWERESHSTIIINMFICALQTHTICA